MMKNTFYFPLKPFFVHYKSSFCSQDIQFFALTFWSCKKWPHQKNELILKFMTSQSGKQTIAIHLSKLSIFLDQQSNVYSFFIVYQVESYQNIMKISCRLLAFTSHLFFEENKEVWNQPPCLISCKIFEEKYFSCYILLTDQISLSCLYFVRYYIICAL